MKQLGIIWRWTARETIRDRVLWAYGIFAVLLLLGLYAVGKVPWGETHIIVGQLGYTAIGLVSQVLAALIVSVQLGRDADRRIHYMILGRDTSRRSYLLGRFFGLWSTTTLIAFALVLMLFVLNTIQAGYRGPMWSLFGAMPALAAQIAMVLAVSTLIYQVSSSTTLAMIISTLVVVIGRMVASAQSILREFGEAPAAIGRGAAYVFPNLELVTFNHHIIYEAAPARTDVLTAALYAACFVVAMLTAAVLVFERKEL